MAGDRLAAAERRETFDYGTLRLSGGRESADLTRTVARAGKPEPIRRAR